MYFGKPLPEWIIEHREDTFTLGEFIDEIEKRQKALASLQTKLLENGLSSSMVISAYAYFEKEIEKNSEMIRCVISLLGERYGYPDDPKDDRKKEEQ